LQQLFCSSDRTVFWTSQQPRTAVRLRIPGLSGV
jgi:hypothetical protein